MRMRKRILVVDDDEAVLDYMRAKLGVRFEIVVTDDADSVLQIARQQMPDLIICDVDMPDMDGGDVSAALYGDDDTRDIPLLFLTGLASEQVLDQLSGQLAGRVAISKSAPIEKLVAAIERALGA
ncbi:MAG TPA: response regulator [Burkholderiales bacterium]